MCSATTVIGTSYGAGVASGDSIITRASRRASVTTDIGTSSGAGVASRVRIHVGDALTALAETPGEFDFVFNDVDKQGYLDVLEAVTVRLCAGGLFVTDNALRRGRVLNPREEKSRRVAEFNRKLFKSKDFWTTLIPLRDGVLVSVKR